MRKCLKAFWELSDSNVDWRSGAVLVSLGSDRVGVRSLRQTYRPPETTVLKHNLHFCTIWLNVRLVPNTQNMFHCHIFAADEVVKRLSKIYLLHPFFILLPIFVLFLLSTQVIYSSHSHSYASKMEKTWNMLRTPFPPKQKTGFLAAFCTLTEIKLSYIFFPSMTKIIMINVISRWPVESWPIR